MPCFKPLHYITLRGHRNLYQNIDIVTDIKPRRVEWLGYLISAENNRIPRIVLDSKVDGKSKGGRPKLRWSDDVQADLKIIGLKDVEENPKTYQNGCE
jgi:hypothetical protein